METEANLLVIIGWPVSVLTTALATLITSKLLQQKRELSWSLDAEDELISAGLSEHAGAPVSITVGEHPVGALSVIVLRFACTGNIAVGNVSGNEGALQLKISIGTFAKILDIKLNMENEEAKQHVNIAPEPGGARLSLRFMNPGDEVGVQLLLADYTLGAADVHFAYPGVRLRRMTRTEYAVRIARQATSLSFGLFGIGFRTEPNTEPLYDISRSLQSIERLLQRGQHAGDEAKDFEPRTGSISTPRPPPTTSETASSAPDEQERPLPSPVAHRSP